MAKYAHIKGLRIERLTDVIRVTTPSEHFVTADAPVGCFRVDSRLVAPGDVFVAVKGARTDGHKYVDQVLANGAAAALVSSLEHVTHRERCIVVPDTLEALRLLAAHHRRAMDVRIIGLTGSVGKTTTKELLAGIMACHGRTRRSEGNYNNTIGLPMELLKLQPDERWMVAEMGMSTPGEIAELVDMADPDIALFLCVKAVHLANFADLEAIARAKAELVQGLRPDAALVYNADDPLVVRYSASHPGPRISYGVRAARADITARIEPFPTWDGTTFFLTDTEDREHELHLPMVGRFNVFNAVAACAAALTAGVPSSELRRALAGARGDKGRSCLHDLPEDVLLVDDTYNANPHAVEEVLRSFAPLAAHHYRWLVLGDMLELGKDEHLMHYRIGSLIAGYGFNRVTLVGPLSAHTHRALLEACLPDAHIEHFADASAAVSALDPRVPSGARIWCKASRGIGLEVVARHLIERIHSPSKG